MRVGIALFYLLFLSFFTTTASAQSWELKLDQDGIKIYTRKKTGSGVKEFRGEVIVNSNLSTILALIDSIPAYPKWMYKCTYAERLKKINQASGYSYNIIKAPWPVSDRDVCTYYYVKQDTSSKVVTITMKGVKDYIPEKPGIVRMPKLIGFWELTPIKKGVTKVIYQLHCESGGSIPEAIVNAYITDTPYNNLLNLKKIVESPYHPKANMKLVKEL
ncbi:MAG: START domain-containing protein [Bacteroidales bacterium]|jgi:ribosome-associated toxin RatA of RatAB toxin-antitoxin module|nr:START domain-containing protein [Bacteroidales bacterium]